MIPELPGSSREEADVTTPSQEGRPEGEALVEKSTDPPGYTRPPMPAGATPPNPRSDPCPKCRSRGGHYSTCPDHTYRAPSPATPNGQGGHRTTASDCKFWTGDVAPVDYRGSCRSCNPAAPSPASLPEETEPIPEDEVCRCGHPARRHFSKVSTGKGFCIDCGACFRFEAAVTSGVDNASPASPAETGANSKLRQVAPNLGATSSAPSPAETREGRAVERLRRLQDVVHDDLSDLLEALGMGTYARPYSSHELMQEAIARVRDLRGAASPPAVPLPEETAEEGGWVPKSEPLPYWSGASASYVGQTPPQAVGFTLGTEPPAAPSLPGEQPGGQR